MADGIFISYKRGADSADARSLYSTLRETFGDRVRMDIDSFPLGEDFVAHIRGELDKCHVVLVVVGRGFHERLDELQSDGDFMRLELEQALGAEDKKIIPVFFDGAVMPKKDSVPKAVQDLVFRGGLKVDHENAGIILRHKLIPDLERIFEALPPAPELEPEPEPEPAKPIATHLTREYLRDGDASHAVTRMVKPEDIAAKFPPPSGKSLSPPKRGLFGALLTEISEEVRKVAKFVAPVVLLLATAGMLYSLNSSFADFADGILGRKHVSGLRAGEYQGIWKTGKKISTWVSFFEDENIYLSGFSADSKPIAYLKSDTPGVFINDGGSVVEVMSGSSFSWRNKNNENWVTYIYAK